MRRFSLLSVAVLALGASGCLGGSAGGCNDQGGSCGEPTVATPTGELRGLVVVQGGPVMPNTARPLKNARIVLTARSPTGETIIRHLSTDEHGNFGLRLQPGWYTLTAQFTLPNLLLSRSGQREERSGRSSSVHRIHQVGDRYKLV
jgi:hypothetical protein